MGFFDELLLTISGEGRREQAAKTLAAQLELSNAQLEQMRREEELKNSPEAQKRKAQRNMWIGIGFVVLIIVVGYLIYQRRIRIPKVTT